MQRNSRLSLALLLGSALLPSFAAAQTPPPDRTVVAKREVHTVRQPHGALLLEKRKRGFLGLDVLDMSPELRRHFQADESSGVLVSHVEPGSPAERAGVAVGDVITAVDGRPIDGEWGLLRLVGPHKAGDTVTVDVVRDGRRQQLRATLEERDQQVLELGRFLGGDPEALAALTAGQDWKRMGVELGNMGEKISASMAQAFADPQVQMRLRERVEDREQLQRRIDELEKRLRDLERRLEDHQRR